MEYTYKTKMVCSKEIKFDIEGDVITNVRFLGGCNGNLKAISKLVDGYTVEQIEEKLKAGEKFVLRFKSEGSVASYFLCGSA